MAKPNQYEEKLISARIRMLLNMPFYGNLAVRLKLVDATNWCPTAGTDGKHFYYNRDFLDKLDKKEIEFLFGHEVMHCVYDHMERRGSRDPQLWNCAADYVINLELVDGKCGKLIHHPGEIEPCYDEKYRDMTADQVYELLKEESEKNGNKKEEHSFDMHMDPAGSDGEGGEGGDGEDDGTGADGPISMSEDERDILKDEWVQSVQEAAKVAHGGHLPGGVKRMIDHLKEPKMNWDEYLNKEIQALISGDFTFSKPNRKSSGMGGGIILPGQIFDKTVSVMVGIDTSGSISNSMLVDFVSEVAGIMSQFTQFELKVFSYDTKCYTMYEYNESNIDDLDDIEFEGRGGNDSMNFVWDWLEERGEVPDTFVNFTDGYLCCRSREANWGREPEFSTVHVIWGNGARGKEDHETIPTYGTWVSYDEQ